jgi:hypothetical protein
LFQRCNLFYHTFSDALFLVLHSSLVRVHVLCYRANHIIIIHIHKHIYTINMEHCMQLLQITYNILILNIDVLDFTIYIDSNEIAVNLLKLFVLTNILVNFISGLKYKIQSWIKKQGEKNFLLSVQVGSGAHPASYPVCNTGWLSPPHAKVEDMWRYTSQWSGSYEIQHRNFTCVWPVLL